LKARTGELTPPGISSFASKKVADDLVVVNGSVATALIAERETRLAAARAGRGGARARQHSRCLRERGDGLRGARVQRLARTNTRTAGECARASHKETQHRGVG
jgi:hypothetical protein